MRSDTVSSLQILNISGVTETAADADILIVGTNGQTSRFVGGTSGLTFGTALLVMGVRFT